MHTPRNVQRFGSAALVARYALAAICMQSALICSALGCAGKPAATPDSSDNSSDNASGSSDGYRAASDPPAAKPASTSAPQIQERADRNKNTYDKEQTEIQLRRAARQAKANCGLAKDEAGLATGPWGKLNVTVTLGHNGHLRSSIVPAPYADKPVGKCIEKAFTGIVFPTWEGSDIDLDWEVEVMRPDAAAAKPK
jgi:hypothetical protein